MYLLVTRCTPLCILHRSVAEPSKEMLVLEVWYAECTLNNIALATSFNESADSFSTEIVMNRLKQVAIRSKD